MCRRPQKKTLKGSIPETRSQAYKMQGSRALCPRFIHDLFKHVLQVMYFIGFCQFLIKAVI